MYVCLYARMRVVDVRWFTMMFDDDDDNDGDLPPVAPAIPSGPSYPSYVVRFECSALTLLDLASRCPHRWRICRQAAFAQLAGSAAQAAMLKRVHDV